MSDRPVRLLSLAVDEIAAAAQWFNEQSPGLGDEFWRLTERQLALVEENPQRFGKSEFAGPSCDLRFAYVERFRYVVHFAIEPDEVVVLAVAHAARRPGYWLLRLGE